MSNDVYMSAVASAPLIRKSTGNFSVIQAFKRFAKAIQFLEDFCSNLPIKYLIVTENLNKKCKLFFVII